MITGIPVAGVISGPYIGPEIPQLDGVREEIQRMGELRDRLDAITRGQRDE
jgi:hypothetical protein